jgi:hypothetical protein
MVSAWWLLVAACGGMSIGMILFAVMTMAAEPSQLDVEAGGHGEALT